MPNFQASNTCEIAIDSLCKRDKKFAAIVSQLGRINFGSSELTFQSLLKLIISQQLSGKSSEKIFQRLKKHFGEKQFIDPKDFISVPSINLRDIGISNNKIIYMKELAKTILLHPDLLESWESLSDPDVVKEIQKLKGFGPWSASIIMISKLERQDVFPFGDATLRKAYLNIYGKNLTAELRELEWARPYRSFLARYLWLWVDRGMKELT